MDCNLPVFFIHRIFQARILEWVTISFSRRSSWPRDWTQVSHIVGRHFTVWATREVKYWRMFPLCLISGKIFFLNHKWALNFIESSFWVYWDYHFFFWFFNLLIYCIKLIDLYILKNFCIPKINLTWSWYMILLMYCWIQITVFCWVFLCLCSPVIWICNFFSFLFYFFWYICLVLVSKWW